MKKFSKLVAVSAAAMTFGITGVSALQVASASNVSSTYATNLKNAQSNMDKVSGYKSYDSLAEDKQVLDNTANMILSPSNSETPQQVLQSNSLSTATCLGDGLKSDENEIESDAANNINNAQNDSEKAQLQSLWQAEDGVLKAIYANTNDGSNAQNANKQTANNDNKQNANNNNNANAQNNSSSKKADVVANANNNNANNNNAKKDNAQGAVANKQNTNNEANAQQNTVKSNANVEGTKTVANENESNSAKNQNNGAIAETQNENTTAAGETSTVVKAQAKSANNSAAQKNNTPVFPQTGEQTSEILAVAGGLIIAATAAGIVVYKKRN
ncbi:LPXTG cell wall anchor domain-containing protein [Ligilactobacillus aviarius]|uniref:LPXTG cell wall anchor domain-containing protein n=1 Tax=Ligilactobacillus aviarius TaxID=1606 RepID=UPI0024B9C8FF|nr:LPXTG cell wall anchor domain-containing protein [Ligilactobacillus aviarius]